MSLFGLALLLLSAQDGPRRVLDELRTYDEQIASLEEQAAGLETRAAAVEVERAAAAAAVAEADAALAERRDETRRRLQTFYRLKRRGFARLLFDAEDPLDLRRRVRYLLHVLRADEASTRAYAERLAAQRAASETLESDARALAGLRTDLETRRAALETERQRRRQLVRSVQAQPELAAMVVQERAAAARDLSESIAQEGFPATDGGAAAFRSQKGRLPAPVAGRVVRGFGTYTDPTSGATAENLGIDYAATLGTPFRAVADGVVTRSAYVRGYGQVVIVQHGAYTTLYAHANGLRVAQGQAVRRGDVLGLVGNTGLPEDAEARLHFELRYNNTPQDPAPWLAP